MIRKIAIIYLLVFSISTTIAIGVLTRRMDRLSFKVNHLEQYTKSKSEFFGYDSEGIGISINPWEDKVTISNNTRANTLRIFDKVSKIEYHYLSDDMGNKTRLNMVKIYDEQGNSLEFSPEDWETSQLDSSGILK